MIRDLEAWPPGAVEPQHIRVTFHEPVEDPPAWSCRLEIGGVVSPFSKPFFGEDALAALLAAVSIAPRVLCASVPPGTRLTWEGREDLGFALPALPSGDPGACARVRQDPR